MYVSLQGAIFVLVNCAECFYLIRDVLFSLHFLQSDENEDHNVDAQNGDHESSTQQNKLNMGCKEKSKKYLFNLTLVNSYGSADIQALSDNDETLKVTGKMTVCKRCRPRITLANCGHKLCKL